MAIQFRTRLDFQSQMAHVANDPNDSDPRVLIGVRAEAKAFAEGVFARPETCGHRFVDDGSRRLIRIAILIAEAAPGYQWYAHRLKVIIAGATKIAFPLLAFGDWFAFNGNGGRYVVVGRAEYRQAGDNSDRRYIRQRFESLFNLAVKLGALLRLTELCLRQVGAENQDVFGQKSRLDIQQAGEAFDQQSGAGQQNQRQRHFAHDQRRAQPLLSPTGRRALAALFQGFADGALG